MAVWLLFALMSGTIVLLVPVLPCMFMHDNMLQRLTVTVVLQTMWILAQLVVSCTGCAPWPSLTQVRLYYAVYAFAF